MHLSVFFFFFFQAEDGIRDYKVTRVQTCALPISDCRVLFHNWWNAPRTWATVLEIDPVASHGSWMENFPWTRLPDVEMPAVQRPMVDLARVRTLDPISLRGYIGDGNYGGLYQRS